MPRTTTSNASNFERMRLLFRRTLLARDAWERMDPTSNVKAKPYKDYVDWILAMFTNPDLTSEVNQDASDTVEEFLRELLNAAPHTYSVDDVRTKLRLKTNSRNYRWVIACDGPHADVRVRHFFLSYMGKSDSVPLVSFLNYAWTGAGNKVGGGVTDRRGFPAKISNPFERLLTLALILRARKQLRLSSRGHKRKRRGSQSTASSANEGRMVGGVPTVLRAPNASVMHRFMYAVQAVVQCWSVFIRRYGYVDIEQFVLPYVQLDPAEVCFTVIDSRNVGFPVDKHISETEWDHATEVTTKEQPVFAKAFNASAQHDAFHRQAARAFLDHCFSVVCSMSLYDEPTADTWTTGRSLRTTSTSRRAVALNNVLPQPVIDYFANLDTELPATAPQQRSNSLSRTSGSAATGGSSRAGNGRSANNEVNRNVENQDDSLVVSAAERARQSQVLEDARLQPVPTQAELDEAVDTVRKYFEGKSLHMFNCDFEDLVDCYDEFSNDPRPLEKSVKLAFTDPPFNTRREGGQPNSDYDSITIQEMAKYANLVVHALMLGGHAVTVCSIQQHAMWKTIFRHVPEDGYHSSIVENELLEITDIEKLPVCTTFAITNDPLLFIYHHNAYSQGRHMNATHHNATMYAFHGVRRGLSNSDARAMVNWRHHGYINTKFPAYKHIMDNVPRLAPGEQVRAPVNREEPSEEDEIQPAPGSSSARRRGSSTRALRNEQKPLPCILELVMRYTMAGEAVMDAFGGTFSTAVATHCLPEHRKFIGSEKDKSCCDVAFPSVYRRIAVYLASQKTDFRLSQDVWKACQVVFRHHLYQRRGDELWRAPNSLPQYQRIPRHTLAALLRVMDRPDLMRENAGVTMSCWPRVLQEAFLTVDTNLLLEADCAANGVFIATSTIRHRNAGLGCFATRAFEQGDLIGTYFGTLVYHNLFPRLNAATKIYGDGLMGITKRDFVVYAYQVTISSKAKGFKDVTDLLDGRVAVHIVPPPFCSMRYINDARYLQDDAEKTKEAQDDCRAPNVAYTLMDRPIMTPKDLEYPDVIHIRATRPIHAGEELFGNYASGYAAFNTDAFHEGTL